MATHSWPLISKNNRRRVLTFFVVVIVVRSRSKRAGYCCCCCFADRHRCCCLERVVVVDLVASVRSHHADVAAAAEPVAAVAWLGHRPVVAVAFVLQAASGAASVDIPVGSLAVAGSVAKKKTFGDFVWFGPAAAAAASGVDVGAAVVVAPVRFVIAACSAAVLSAQSRVAAAAAIRFGGILSWRSSACQLAAFVVKAPYTAAACEWSLERMCIDAVAAAASAVAVRDSLKKGPWDTVVRRFAFVRSAAGRHDARSA